MELMEPFTPTHLTGEDVARLAAQDLRQAEAQVLSARIGLLTAEAAHRAAQEELARVRALIEAREAGRGERAP